MANKGTELAKTEPGGALAELDELQALLRENAGAGLDNIRPEDIILPRLTIIQPTHPLATEDGYQVGDIVNSISNENYGKRYEFFVLHYYPNRVKFETEELGTPVECRSDNGITGTKFGKCAPCPHAQWQDDPEKPGQQKRPACTEFKNLIVQPADDLGASPIVISSKRSALKPTSQLLSALATSRKAAYASSWVLESVKNQKDRLTWFTPKFTKGADIATVAQFMSLKATSDAMIEAQSRIRFEQEDEHAGAAAPGDEAGF